VRATLVVIGILVTFAAMPACSSSDVVSSGGQRDGGLTDRPAATDAGQLACGDAACGRLDICVVPPCGCIVVGDGGSVCAPPYCAAPTPANPITCNSGPEFDGGIGGTFISTADAGSRRCYQLCF
jgi:hypothetical protein